MNVSNLEWRELFGSALLELDAGKLIGRIEEARSAISVRLRELPHDSDHRSERGSMYDALYALKFLRSRIPRGCGTGDHGKSASTARSSGAQLSADAAPIPTASKKRSGEPI
jgi:hypothetical protein